VVGKYNEKWSTHLFDKVTRGLLTRTAVNEFERIQKAFPDKSAIEIMKTVARDSNNMFGSIGRQGWIKSRTFQDLARMTLLAPQWFEGIVKKDFAIPYKLMTGLHNGKALEVLRGQDTIARGITRGALFMLAATQVWNLITKGKPTWQNDDKEHKFDADLGNGVFISPLSLYNEILHDIVRYGETKPKVWDAISQIGENKLGFYARAALVLATDKSPTGEYKTTTAGVLTEAAKQFAPVPITLKSGAAVPLALAQGHAPTADDVRGMMGLAGLKAEVQRSAVARMQTQANDFVESNGLDKGSMVFSPTDEPSYSKVRHFIDKGDERSAVNALDDLRKTRGDRDILKAMKMWMERPLTGSRKNERLWLHSMYDSERAQYQQAIEYKRDLYLKFVDLFLKNR
jgi:hypothetical protein